MRLFRYQLSFAYPDRPDVVVLEGQDRPYLVRALDGLKVTTYRSRDRSIVVRPRFLFWLLWYALKSERIVASLAAYLRSTKVSRAIAMDIYDIDLPSGNRPRTLLGEVARLVPSVNCYSVQIGEDFKRRPTATEHRRVTYLCFGQWGADHYPELGRSEHQFVPVGSLMNSLYLEIRPKSRPKNAEICVISKLKSSAWWGDNLDARGIGYKQLICYLRRYCDAYGVIPLVAVTNDRDQNTNIDGVKLERDYFLQNLGQRTRFTNCRQVFGGLVPSEESRTPLSVQERFGTYYASDTSELTIGMTSTALWEALARGNKLLAVNMTNEPRFDFPVHGVWSLCRPTYGEFERRVNELRSMSQANWNIISQTARQYLIVPDTGGDVPRRIRETLMLSD